MSDVGIRAYRPSDLAACRSLWVELTQAHRDIYESPTIGGDDPGAQFDRHLDRVGADRVWVAVDDGAVVGLTGLIVDEDTNEIDPVVVSAEHRGQGIGEMLVGHVIAVARQAGTGTLSVRVAARNQSALSFYHNRGFRVLGMIELVQDLREGDRPWRPGDPLADKDFLV